MNPALPVILAANRDEFYARPATPPVALAPGIVGGRDLISGGTWLALRTDGAFAAVTNQRSFGARDPARRTRGELPLALLAGAARELPRIAAAIDAAAYSAANLIFGSADAIWVAYLRPDDGPRGTVEVVALGPGLHVLANDRLESPRRLRSNLVPDRRSEPFLVEQVDQSGQESEYSLSRSEFPRAEHLAASWPASAQPWPALAAALGRLLGDHARPPDDRIPLPPPCAPYGHEFLASLQQICIHTPTYGTRSSTIAGLVPGRVAHYLYADGPPCTTSFVDVPLAARAPA